LLKASEEGHIEVVKLLLDNGADVNANDGGVYTALMWACMQDYTELVKILLDRGADINVKDVFGQTALTLVSSESDPEILNLLHSYQGRKTYAVK
jgi:ankyrin repeat protein